MELTSEQRILIVESLGLMLEEKECEIQEIRKKTEEDYGQAKRMTEKFSSKPFSLELRQERDIQKVRVTMNKIQELEKMINSGEHRILAVPRFIRLNLTAE